MGVEFQIINRIPNKAVDHYSGIYTGVLDFIVQVGNFTGWIGVNASQFYILVINFIAAAFGIVNIINTFNDENIPEVLGIGKVKVKGSLSLGNAQVKFQV